MKRLALISFIAAIAVAASAQTNPKPSTTNPSTPKSTSSTAKASTAAPSNTTSATEPWFKLPPGVPRVAHGPVKIPFSLRYEDITVGTGPEGEAGKIWHIKYTGWRAADGVKFDSWAEHTQPVIGKDGKPELGPDGKPKMSEPQPVAFPQGMGRVIPGFDYGLTRMKVGGKRRLFIPWQMAYGTRDIPDRPDHPGIPAKSDLIFDVELVDVTEMPAPHPMPPRPMPGGPPHPGAGTPPGAPPVAPAAPPTGSTAPAPKPPTAAPAQPAATTQPATNAQPTTPAQTTAPAQPSTPTPPTNTQSQPK